jgi:hypothetical protein
MPREPNGRRGKIDERQQGDERSRAKPGATGAGARYPAGVRPARIGGWRTAASWGGTKGRVDRRPPGGNGFDRSSGAGAREACRAGPARVRSGPSRPDPGRAGRGFFRTCPTRGAAEDRVHRRRRPTPAAGDSAAAGGADQEKPSSAGEARPCAGRGPGLAGRRRRQGHRRHRTAAARIGDRRHTAGADAQSARHQGLWGERHRGAHPDPGAAGEQRSSFSTGSACRASPRSPSFRPKR